MKKILHILGSVFACLFCTVIFAATLKPAQLTAIKISNAPSKVVLTLYLSRHVSIKTLLKNGNLKIVLPDTVLKLPKRQTSWHSSASPLVKKLTLKVGKNQLSFQGSQVKATKISSFWQLQPRRLVIELTKNNSNIAKPTKKTTIITGNRKTAVKKGANKFVIVLDPGHGGRDAGAIGVGAVLEKKVNLAIARRLKQHLEATGKVKVWLTRTKDIELSKQKRMDFARLHNAQFFISLHADADPQRKAEGASVFVLSARGANRVAARWLRTKDRRSALGRLLSHRQRNVRSLLINMAQNASGDSSLKLGRSILQSLAKVTKLHTSRVNVAAFWVLKAPEIPSLLVETGFISHPDEGRRLGRADYQEKLAKALTSGIMQYIEQNEMNYANP